MIDRAPFGATGHDSTRRRVRRGERGAPDDQESARRRWDGREHTAATCYEPLREPADIDLAIF